MRALVVGASGLVGKVLLRALRRAGIDSVGTYNSRPVTGAIRLDVRDWGSVQKCLDAVEPNVVFVAVNPAGGVDFCEYHPEEVYALNVQGTRNILEAAGRDGPLLVYYSTDYVFDGAAGPYDEEAEPRPINVYGRTKLEAERTIREWSGEHLILRTTAVFGWDRGSPNFAMRVWEHLQSGKAIRVADDQWCNPTLADYLAEITVRVVQKGTRGILNVVGKARMPRSDFAKALAASMALEPSLIIPVPTSETGQRADRPLQGGLKTNRLEYLLGTVPLDLSEALKRFHYQRNTDSETTHTLNV